MRYQSRMPQIDLEPRKHSSSYELRPMSRWWLVVAIAMCLLGAFVNGFWRAETWGLIFFGAILGFALILIFPRFWLSRITDD